MPELPEVETTVNFLKSNIINKKITDVWSDYQPNKFSFCNGFNNFKKELVGRVIKSVFRRAKNILLKLDNNKILLIHQKMTGHLLLGKWKKGRLKNWKSPWLPLFKGKLQDPYNDYIHLMIFLSDGNQIAMSDLRKFGKIRIYQSINDIEELKKLGPEPLDKNFTWKVLKQRLANKNQAIKKVLMDQNVIAGIGNIYSDDILWCAKIHPLKKAKYLKENEVQNIFKCIRKILKEAIKCQGTSIQDYRQPNGKKGYYQDKRKVYKREGQICKRCKKGIIKRIKINSRSSCFCPQCQKN
jgi:formamidopyrimidine-DNA glycosylase